MTIVKVVTKDAAPLPQLFRLALRFIYDRLNMPIEDIRLMESSMVNWTNHIQYKKDLCFDITGIPDELNNDEYNLQVIAELLDDNMKGKLERRKWLLQEYHIPYQKFYRLKEFYTPEDFERGRQIMEELKRTNPEENL